MVDTVGVRAALKGGFKGVVEEDAPLAGYTTFRIGGPADLLVVPKGIDDLMLLAQAVADTGAGLLVLGRGSNVLISDRGFRGVAAVLSGGLGRVKREGKAKVHVESGCDLNRLISWTIEREMGGLEDLAGIPGSVGGGVRMNAGALGSAIGERVEGVSVLRLEDGKVEDREVPAERIGFGYRETGLADNEIIYKVKLKLYKAEKGGLKSRRKEVLEWRRVNQPLRRPSAGSVFRNPEGVSAGELIDRCGLKGMREGEAMVSGKHANFIVNLGKARAEDVYRLIKKVKREVREREGIELREEIKLIGEMGEEES
jgi:UDP-N-acetylmuramate dehydrogenase